MIQQLLHTVLVSVICIIWGIPVLLWSQKYLQADRFWFVSLPGLLAFLFFMGCISVGVLSSWLLLFLPLKFPYLLLLTFILTTILFLKKFQDVKNIFKEVNKTRTRVSIPEYVYLFLGIILFVIMGSVKPVNLDMQIYHLQIIRWQTEYGTVPGMANLFPRFGQGSNWFNLVSFFYLPFLKASNFAYVNISFVSWFFIWLFFKCRYHLNQEDHKTHRLLSLYYFCLFIFFMLDWQLYRDAANSTNYDVPVTAFIIMAISFLIEKFVTNEPVTSFSPLFLLLAIAAISFKFSAIFLILLIIYYLLLHNKYSRWLWTGVAGVIIVLPVLIRNYITSGYPFFPHTFSISTPDWKVPEAFAKGYFQFLLDYNRFFNYWMFIGKVPDTPLNWVPYWYKGILIQHKIILFLAAGSLVLLIVKPLRDINYRNLRILIVIGIFMIAGWFFSAPDPARFGYGFLLPLAFLTFSIFAAPFFYKAIFKMCLFISIAGVAYYSYNKMQTLVESPVHFLYPMTSDTPPYQNKEIEGMEVHVPEIINNGWDHRCFNTVLPCMPGDNPYIKPRGSSLKQGFKMMPPDSAFLKQYLY